MIRIWLPNFKNPPERASPLQGVGSNGSDKMGHISVVASYAISAALFGVI
jgi:hypothetical protein